VRAGRIWIELKALEEIDARYAEVLDSLYGELQAAMSSPRAPFQTFKRKLNLGEQGVHRRRPRPRPAASLGSACEAVTPPPVRDPQLSRRRPALCCWGSVGGV
jgi:hypothetical protein